MLTKEAQNLVNILKTKNELVSTTESLTGGLLADLIVSVSGASGVFGYGWVTYSNEAKVKEVGVSEETLNKYGAVSKETAMEMAKGCALASGSNLGISTTGVAGPSMDEGKAVGRVYIGVYYEGNVSGYECHFTGDRQKIRQDAACEAIKLALRILGGNL